MKIFRRSAKKTVPGVIAALVIGSSVAAGAAEEPARHAVVVELFTSQGCSSCPPADHVLSKLGEEEAGRVIPLAFHVDYWNHGGWADPFSRHEWTERQMTYDRVLGLQAAYTPQAVVDGRAELIGSKEDALRAAIARAAKEPAATIALRLVPSGDRVAVTADVDLPEALRARKWALLLAVFEKGLLTSVSRGENGGRSLHNDFVVRSLRRIAKLKAGGPGHSQFEAAVALDKDWKRSELGVAAFLQDPHSLEIRGAARSPLVSAPSAQ